MKILFENKHGPKCKYGIPIIITARYFIFQAWSTHGALIFIHQIFEFFVLSTYI